jgi:hypothetical protein
MLHVTSGSVNARVESWIAHSPVAYSRLARNKGDLRFAGLSRRYRAGFVADTTIAESPKWGLTRALAEKIFFAPLRNFMGRI